MDHEELLWRQYNLNAELYKHYLKIVLEFNAFYYAITGAIVSYFFAHADLPMMRYALWLPLVMSVSFAGLLMYGAGLSGQNHAHVIQLRKDLGIIGVAEPRLLGALLWVFAALKALIAFGLAYLLYLGPFTAGTP